jgi:hypothetical protein
VKSLAENSSAFGAVGFSRPGQKLTRRSLAPGSMVSLNERIGPAQLAPVLKHRRVEHAVALELVELRQECVGDAIVLSISFHLGGERFVVAEDLPQDGVGAGANARPVLVLDDDPTIWRKCLLAKSGCLRDPGHSILLATLVVGSRRHQQALIREPGAGCFGQIGDSDSAASDRQKRQLKLMKRGTNIVVANHCTLVDLELRGNAVNLGFKIDEVDRIGRGQGDVVRIREVDVGQRKGDGQRDGRSRRVDELIAHGDAVERYPQILAFHCNVVGTDKL